ncbi:MAG: sigma-70 family RNA polymerase sigma factor [Oscillospiraceae bacterium]|nr:sigma-70 family RNA polymerase sigma factor [Oscillospiraceae bacterium]
MNDAKALMQLQAGDMQALEWFIDRYSAYVGTIVKNILQGSMSQSDVEEVTSDVFLILWKSAEKIVPFNIKGWLSRVSRSLALRKLRERTNDLPLEEDILILEEDSLIDALDRQERDRLVREAVLSMPQPDREIFLRFYYYCQSISVIAEKMKMNPSTVKTRLRRGREKLKEHLTGIKTLKGDG